MVSQPPSFECGYECFKLLASILNLCLLDRCNQLDEALVTYQAGSYANLQIVFSVTLSRVIEMQAKISDAGGNCDLIFGWSSSTSRTRQTALLMPADTLVLLDILWDYRKDFLKAMLSSSPPPLSGLLFLFLRSIVKQPSLRALDWESTKCKLHELALRYMLIGEEHWNQHKVMVEILAQIDSEDSIWGRNPKYADTEDSRCISQAFVNMLSNHTLKAFPMQTPYILLRLIVLSVDTHSQGILPTIVGLLIEYAWSMVIRVNGEADLVPFVQGLFCSLTMLLCPPHNAPYELADSTQHGLMTALHQADVLDLVARVIAGLEPAQRVSLPLSDKNAATVQIMFRFFVLFCEIVPEEKLADCFQDYLTDWWKFNQYMQVNASRVMRSQSGAGACHDHYKNCSNIWLWIADGLGLGPTINAHRDPRLCKNPRCPTLFSYNHVHHGCERGCVDCDQLLVYCNDRCQAV
ncbi:unnamed protein product [Rhizoctonia solani]|uniref:MYND-type domain-containing protein n=1 Tax=Rhizoctonia solani TaxID=456999 RepID=A0A8H3DZZ4_9AGAM|nr:unnamed protein product [Rhizoctonia solani]